MTQVVLLLQNTQIIDEDLLTPKVSYYKQTLVWYTEQHEILVNECHGPNSFVVYRSLSWLLDLCELVQQVRIHPLGKVVCQRRICDPPIRFKKDLIKYERHAGSSDYAIMLLRPQDKNVTDSF